MSEQSLVNLFFFLLPLVLLGALYLREKRNRSK